MQIGEIKEIQKFSPVLSMDAERPLDAAIQEMCLNNRGSIAVTEKGRLAGIVTERDLLHKILGAHRDTESLRVRDVMNRDIEALHLDDELSEGLKKMKSARLRHLPVVDEDGRVVAMVSQSDFVPTGPSEAAHIVKETVSKKAYDWFQPWMIAVGLGVYFIVTTVVILAYFGFRDAPFQQ